MNKHVLDEPIIALDLPREVDSEVAGDIEKESVFVSPFIERIAVEAGRRSVRVHLKRGAPVDEVMDKARRYLGVMSRQISGFDIKVFVETKRANVSARPCAPARSSTPATNARSSGAQTSGVRRST